MELENDAPPDMPAAPAGDTPKKPGKKKRLPVLPEIAAMVVFTILLEVWERITPKRRRQLEEPAPGVRIAWKAAGGMMKTGALQSDGAPARALRLVCNRYSGDLAVWGEHGAGTEDLAEPSPAPATGTRVRYMIPRALWDALDPVERLDLERPPLGSGARMGDGSPESHWTVRASVVESPSMQVGSPLSDVLARDVRLVEVPEGTRQCSVCGCVEAMACPGGCTWAGPELCSACDAAGASPAKASKKRGGKGEAAASPAPVAMVPQAPAVRKELPHAGLRPPPWNPPGRSIADPELVESIRTQGLLQDLTARPMPDGGHEIVCGCRRHAALGVLGVAMVPCIIRELTDQQALEVGLVDNLQRTDLSPAEEAEGYRLLHETHKLTVPEIAAKVGHHVSYVYRRLALCGLAPRLLNAMSDGSLSAAAAELFARIPDHHLQVKAFEELVERAYTPLPIDRLRETIVSRYCLELVRAPFDLAVVDLVPGAGACTSCPKRTGCQAELFADVKSPDLCTDPGCFQKKVDADWQDKTEHAESRGQRVLSKAEMKKAFTYQGATSLDWSSPYVDLDARCSEDPKGRTWRKVLGKDLPTITLARDGQGGTHELVDKKDAAKALKAAGKDAIAKAVAPSGSSSGLRSSESESKDREKARRRVEVRRRAVAAIVAAAEKRALDLGALRWMAGALVDESYANTEALVKRRALADGAKGANPQGVARKAIAGATEAELRGFVVELLIGPNAWDTQGLGKAAGAWKVDLKKIEAEITTEARLKAAAKKKPSKPATKKPARKASR